MMKHEFSDPLTHTVNQLVPVADTDNDDLHVCACLQILYLQRRKKQMVLSQRQIEIS